MATFEKTWGNTLGNKAPSDSTTNLTMAKSFLWFITRVLLNNGFSQAANAGAWTVYYSCSSTVAGTAGDAVDRWTTTYDGTKIVRATAGSAHSWFVLTRSLGGQTFYLTIAYDSANDYQANFWLSRTAPTGGSTTATPTLPADAVQVLTNAGTPGIRPTTIAASNFHGTLATDGSFIILSTETGTGRCGFHFHINVLADVASGDVWPVNLYMDSDFNSGTGRAAAWNASTTPTTVHMKNRDKANTTTATYGMFVMALGGLRMFSGTNFIGTTDAQTGQYPDGDILVGFYGSAVANVCPSKKGRLVDIKYAPENIPQANFDPITGATTSCVLGNLWMPWVAVVDGGSNPTAPIL